MSDGPSAREWIADRIHLILSNNNRRLTERLQRAACQGVMEGMGSTPPDRDSYAMMMRGRGPLDRDGVADVVGLYVCDEIRDALKEGPLPEPWGTLLMDLMDLGDAVQRRMIGDDWLPEVDDIDWPVSGEEDDDDVA